MFDRNGQLDAFRAANFITSVVNSVSGTGDDIEGREGGVRHLRIEQRIRNSALARACKERDNYNCQVCGFNFEQRYGGLGKGFAEAHHKVWLQQLMEEKVNSSDELITVCANCHECCTGWKETPETWKR